MDEQTPEHLKPGQVVSPRGAEMPTQSQEAPVATTPVPVQPNAPSPEQTQPLAPVSDTTETIAPSAPPVTPEADWTYKEDAGATEPVALPERLDWTAAEFIAHDKGAQWYGSLAAAGVVAAALDYVVTKDIFSTAIIIIASALFGVYASHKPKQQEYTLTTHGVQVGHRTYDYQNYKAFSVVDEGVAASVVLSPLKRFMPPLTIYVSPEIADQVVDYLAALLPFEQHKPDAVDSLMRRIRF